MRTRGFIIAALLLTALTIVGGPVALADEVPVVTVTAPETATTEQPAEEPAEDPTEEPAEEPAEEPTETQTTSAPNASTDPETSGSTGTTDEPTTPSAEPRRDPRASIGEVNCTDLTIPVTLDNERSTDETTFVVLAGEVESEDPAFDETFEVAGGATLVVQVPVTEDTDVLVFVDADDVPFEGESETLTFAVIVVDCTPDGDPHDPRASIGEVNCTDLTIPVTLDNSRSTDETTFEVVAFDFGSEDFAYEETFEVAAGATLVVQVPVTEDSQVLVAVGDEEVLDETEGEVGTLALEFIDVDCTAGTEQGDAQATIGEVNCAKLTVPVTLDNTRSDEVTTFLVLAGDPEAEEPVYDETFDVAAGATKVVQVPVRNHSRVLVVVGNDDVLTDTEGEEGLLAVEFFDVDCKRMTTDAGPIPRVTPDVAVAGTKLPATGGVNLTLPWIGLALLTSGAALVLLARRNPRPRTH